MNYEKYEKECKQIRKENERLISDFEKWLSNKNLSSKTIEKHTSNVDFYVNEFLLYEDAVEAKDGADEIGMFLGYWFIKKAMWANKTTIKENAASLKKFYQFMYEQGKISEEAFSTLKESIKEEMPEWLATLNRYDDPDIEDMEEVWGL
ncbi:MAG: recombinase [Thermodesulfobacteriota bacterium]|nr:recombinase [Thermodesulfobacteriota bacterium]